MPEKFYISADGWKTKQEITCLTLIEQKKIMEKQCVPDPVCTITQKNAFTVFGFTKKQLSRGQRFQRCRKKSFYKIKSNTGLIFYIIPNKKTLNQKA